MMWMRVRSDVGDAYRGSDWRVGPRCLGSTCRRERPKPEVEY